MQTNRVTLPAPILEAKKLANLTDTAVRIPILRIPVGLDFLIGLIPGAGDVIMLLVALRIVHKARQVDAPRSLQIAMIRNCLIDFALGAIPLVGDIFDLFFKANRANAKMLEKWWLNNNRDALKQQTQAHLDNWEATQQD